MSLGYSKSPIPDGSSGSTAKFVTRNNILTIITRESDVSKREPEETHRKPCGSRDKNDKAYT